jgi:cysteine sulfinate desulfinase/cysteine desulfurase-like protein
VRFCVGRYTTEQDIESAIALIAEALARIAEREMAHVGSAAVGAAK